MFENLSERLERSFKILKGEGKITEINVAETLKDVRRALLEADVNFKEMCIRDSRSCAKGRARVWCLRR